MSRWNLSRKPSEMRQDLVYVNDVTIPDGRRPLDSRNVEQIAESIRHIGLQSPIAVFMPDDKTCELVAGRHRLAAVEQLGWEQIMAVQLGADEKHLIKLWELDENLARTELSPSEKAQAIAARKVEFDRLELTQQDTRGYTVKVGFGRWMYSRTGMHPSEVNAHVRIVKQIPELKELRGTSLDKIRELKALLHLPEKRRNDLIRRAKAGEDVSADTARRLETSRRLMLRRWREARGTDRAWFLEEVAIPWYELWKERTSRDRRYNKRGSEVA